MRTSKPEDQHHANNKPRLHAHDVSVLFASSFFWAWYILALLGPILFAPFDNLEHFNAYRMVVFLFTLISLFFWHKKQDLALRLLNSRRWEILFVSLAVVGNGITVLGIILSSLVIVLLGGFIAGSMAAYFMLAWSRMYSRRGAGSTAASITGAFFIGLLIALVISTMHPIAGVITTAILPFLVVVILIGVQALFYSTENPDTDVSSALQDNPGVAFGATDILVKSRERSSNHSSSNHTQGKNPVLSSKISWVLTLSIVILGFGAGCDFYDYTHGSLSFVVLVAGGVTAVSLFLVAYFKPEWLRIAFITGMLVGISGYLLIPSLGLGEQGGLYTDTLVTVGSISFFAAMWTLFADMTTITKGGSIGVFVQGLLRCYIGVCLGYAFGFVAQQMSSYVSVREESLIAILGFVLIIGLLLLFVGNQTMWSHLKNSLSADPQMSPATTPQAQESFALVKEQVGELVYRFKLTEREGEILELLITGRSRTRIAKALYVSENTVNSHVQHIYRKMNVKNIQELLDFVHEN